MMNNHFETITSVFFKHGYFPNNRFEGLGVITPGNSNRIMANYGLLYKPDRDGFRLLYATRFAGKSRKREEVLNSSITLDFHLLLKMQAFYNFTGNLSNNNIAQSIFYFSNISRNSNGKSPAGRLHKEEEVSEKDRYPVDDFQLPSFSKPFGLLSLKIDKELEETYEIHFSAKSTFWRYILVSDYFRDLHNPTIWETKSHETFTGPEDILLPDGRKALSFTSKNKISLGKSIPKSFQLVEDFNEDNKKYKVAIKTLPLPNIHFVSGAGTPLKDKTLTDFSEIFIY